MRVDCAMGVVVEVFAVRVVIIRLENIQCSVRTQNPLELAQHAGKFLLRDVFEQIRRKHKIYRRRRQE